MSLFVVGGIIAVLYLLRPQRPYRISSNMEVEKEKRGSGVIFFFFFNYFLCVCTRVSLQWFTINHTPQGTRKLGQRIFLFEVLVGLLLFSVELEENRQSSTVFRTNTVRNQKGLNKCCIQSPPNSIKLTLIGQNSIFCAKKGSRKGMKDLSRATRSTLKLEVDSGQLVTKATFDRTRPRPSGQRPMKKTDLSPGKVTLCTHPLHVSSVFSTTHPEHIPSCLLRDSKGDVPGQEVLQ